MTFRWLTRVLALSMVLGPFAATGNDAIDELTLLVDEAIAQNPSVEAMRARTRELSELAEISNAWPDPHVSVEYLNAPVDSFSISNVPQH